MLPQGVTGRAGWCLAEHPAQRAPAAHYGKQVGGHGVNQIKEVQPGALSEGIGHQTVDHRATGQLGSDQPEGRLLKFVKGVEGAQEMGGLVIGKHPSQSVEQRVTVVGDTPVVLERPVPSRTVELAEVQDLMERLYGDDDRERGLSATVAWLCEEMGELAQAVRKGSPDEQLHELGDVLAWLSSLANQLDLSLDEAIERYVTEPP